LLSLQIRGKLAKNGLGSACCLVLRCSRTGKCGVEEELREAAAHPMAGRALSPDAGAWTRVPTGAIHFSVARAAARSTRFRQQSRDWRTSSKCDPGREENRQVTVSWGREGGPRAESLQPRSTSSKCREEKDAKSGHVRYQTHSCGWVDRADSYAASAMCKPLSIQVNSAVPSAMHCRDGWRYC
jgi:hypothetical protein